MSDAARRSPAARWRSTCGAIARRRGWDDRGRARAGAAAQPPGADRAGGRGGALASATTWSRVAYGDCGTLRRARRARRRTGSRATLLRRVRARGGRATRSPRSPGTYFLTDFLARTFEHTVVRELGLDRHPELRDDYFRNYTRVVWLAQRPTPATRARRRARGGAARACRSRCGRSATRARARARAAADLIRAAGVRDTPRGSPRG